MTQQKHGLAITFSALALKCSTPRVRFRTSKGKAMASTTTCILCFEVLHREKNKGNDFNLVAGKGETNVEQELQLLGVYVVPTSKHICRKCSGLIKRRVGHRKKFEDINREIGQLYHEGYAKNIVNLNVRPAKRAMFDETLAEEVNAKKPFISQKELMTTVGPET